MYAVVTLQDSDEVMVVPLNWLSLDKKHCHWPPFKSTEKCTEAIQDRIIPQTGGKLWEKLRICFLGEYATFERAKEEQKEIEDWPHPLDTLLSGVKRQEFESTKVKSNNQPLPPVTPASTPRKSDDDKAEIVQMLRDIKSKVQENSTMLKKILKNNTVSEARSSTCAHSKNFKAKLNLPLGTLEDVAGTETVLKNSATRKKYVKHLSECGGFTTKDVVKKIMQAVITDDLAIQFNWQGRGDKQAFSQLLLTDVIRDAALNRNVNRGDCENEIKKYLSYAAGRKKPKEQEGLRNEIQNVISTSTMDKHPDIGAL
ncbi:uncharacterized protein si:dkey-266f7.5 isoform X4 [Puntigrus tetrazona]|uniref:uncharacterized protein si:dkey-266f7.5 isoform X4 n=1 Tax=Puntigrus tetrazona TaxID=1606681 RepID=UPI001C89A67E|nr:uncharacterized protein si:dkey-266f7.5 isoform X4 [Puntigrus tetrazona]